MVVWGVLAAFMGLKGIQYVARVATYLPLIPLVTLIVMFIATAKGLLSFDADSFVKLHQATVPAAAAPLSAFGLVAFVISYVVGLLRDRRRCRR